MDNFFERSNHLLTGSLYRSTKSYGSFTHIKSMFSDPWYNFIVPHVAPSDLDWVAVQNVLDKEARAGYALLYYIKDIFVEEYRTYFSQNGQQENVGSEVYIAKKNQERIPVEGQLIEIDDNNLQLNLDMGSICFPEWKDNAQYVRYVYNLQKKSSDRIVKNYLYMINHESVGFAGIIASREQNLAYIHNTGVMPEQRRKGHFTNIVHHLMNFAHSQGISDIYALVEEDGGSYNALTKMNFITQEKYYLFETKKD